MNKQITFAKNKMILKYPFYSTLLLNCPMVFTNTVQTAATDGKTIFVNENYIASISPLETVGLLAHEVLHKVFMHMMRLKEYTPKKWNYACDYAINPIILDNGMQLPKGALYEEKYKGMTADAIYAAMPESEEDLPDGPIHLIPAEGDGEQATQEIKQEVAAAYALAKQMGNMPASLEKAIGEFLDPKVSWKEVFRNQFLKSMYDRTVTTWTRLHKKFLSQDLLMPSKHGETTPPLAVMFDTSGSIFSFQELVDQFTAEVKGLIEELSPERVHVIYTDTRVVAHDIFEQGEEFVPNLRGGGGTDFAEFFDYIEEVDAPLLVCMTDLVASGIPQHCNKKTIWVVYGNPEAEAPFGDTINI